MSRDLIDRKEILDRLDRVIIRGVYDDFYEGHLLTAEAVKETILSLPSAQPEIIRCRDCKHHDGIRCFRWNSTIITGFDDFCSNAERRTDE